MLINFIMLITYANTLCKLMSGQIDKMSDQNEDLKGHVLLKKKNYFQPCTKERVENTTCTETFLTNFEVFGNVVKHCFGV